MTERAANESDEVAIADVINRAAQAYRGVIPNACWHDPYMPLSELRDEISDGVMFRIIEHNSRIMAVMGLQTRDDVTLIRHAYVCPTSQRQGYGSRLLKRFVAGRTTPLLIGTWAAAQWAIDFYLGHGFTRVPEAEIEALLRRYWDVPATQMHHSVVLRLG